MIIPRSYLLRMKNILSKSFRGNQNTHFMFNNLLKKRTRAFSGTADIRTKGKMTLNFRNKVNLDIRNKMALDFRDKMTLDIQNKVTWHIHYKMTLDVKRQLTRHSENNTLGLVNKMTPELWDKMSVNHRNQHDDPGTRRIGEADRQLLWKRMHNLLLRIRSRCCKFHWIARQKPSQLNVRCCCCCKQTFCRLCFHFIPSCNSFLFYFPGKKLITLYLTVLFVFHAFFSLPLVQ
jgi:hypothetical protein